MSDALSWSDWMDFNPDTIKTVPESPGVFMMHAAMKVLYIDGSNNVRNSLLDSLSNSCISKSTRFRYVITESYEKTKAGLIDDYRSRHQGNLPKCMENAGLT